MSKLRYGRCPWFARAAAFACAALAGAVPAAPAKDLNAIVGKAWIVDGNVISVNGQKLRLFGIDAPDRKQTCATKAGASYPCGLRAAYALDAMVRGKIVQCEPQGVDARRMVLATCSLSGLDLASAMVEAGWALADMDFAPQYGLTQEAAKAAGVGLWAGRFEPPALWRQSHAY